MVRLPVFGIFTQMLMHVIAHGGCADTVIESALEVDSGRKVPMSHQGIKLSALCLLLRPTLYLLSYPSTILIPPLGLGAVWLLKTKTKKWSAGMTKWHWRSEAMMFSSKNATWRDTPLTADLLIKIKAILIILIGKKKARHEDSKNGKKMKGETNNIYIKMYFYINEIRQTNKFTITKMTKKIAWILMQKNLQLLKRYITNC